MEWGEPSEDAAVHAMRLVYSFSAHNAALAAGPIRDRAIALLSPATTGAAMKARLQLLFDCMAIVQDATAGHDHFHSQPGTGATSTAAAAAVNARVCLTKVLGRRKQLSKGSA